MTPTTPTPEKKEDLAWVDALRGIAILGVMVCHCFRVGLPWRFCGIPFGQWTLAGQYGVQLFFVASAFTLARSWHRRRKESHPTRNYLMRRFFRIAPLYMAGVALYATLALTQIPPFHPDSYTLGAVFANLTFIHGWVPFAQNCVMPGGWSIGVEMSFYLLVPWLAGYLCRPSLAFLSVVIAVPSAVLCAWGAHHFADSGRLGWPVGNNSFLYFWLPTQLPVFSLGFLGYAILNHAPRLKQHLTKWPKRWSLLFLVVILVVATKIPIGDAPPEWPYTFLLSPALAGLAACALLLALALHPWRLLVNPTTVFLGKLSYSLYVVHFIGAWVVAPWICDHVPWDRTTGSGMLATFVIGILSCLAFAIPIAMLTHRYIEKPGIALGKKLIERLETRTARQPA